MRHVGGNSLTRFGKKRLDLMDFAPELVALSHVLLLLLEQTLEFSIVTARFEPPVQRSGLSIECSKAQLGQTIARRAFGFALRARIGLGDQTAQGQAQLVRQLAGSVRGQVRDRLGPADAQGFEHDAQQQAFNKRRLRGLIKDTEGALDMLILKGKDPDNPILYAWASNRRREEIKEEANIKEFSVPSSPGTVIRVGLFLAPDGHWVPTRMYQYPICDR